MLNSSDRRRIIEELIAGNEELELIMARWQQDPPARPEEIKAGQRRYHEWYSRALKLVPPADRERFRDMYEGGSFVQRIQAFLRDPLAISQLYEIAKDKSGIPKWNVQFEGIVRESLISQRQILLQALYEIADAAVHLEELAILFRRLPDYLRTLKNKATDRVPAPQIVNEGDLQIIVLALLRFIYRDVRAEDPIPKHAGGSSRTDFIIRDAGVLVETKMVRKGQRDKDVGDELLIDWGRYPRHPDCRGIFAIIYDPKQALDNPAELESDLTQTGSEISTKAIVVR